MDMDEESRRACLFESLFLINQNHLHLPTFPSLDWTVLPSVEMASFLPELEL